MVLPPKTIVDDACRVLVTGADGFIGRHACAALAASGATVLPVSRKFGPTHDLLRRDLHHSLIADTRPSHLLHLAWYTEHGKFWDSPLNDEWLSASSALFEAFYAAGGKRVAAAGTCAEYDWSQVGDAPIAEAAAIGPKSLYGRSKVECHNRLCDLATKFGGEAAWGRVFFMFGPGEPQQRLVPAMITASLTGTPLDCGPGDLARDFWDVRNVGRAFARLVLSDLEGSINLASGHATRFASLGSIIEDLTGTRDLIRFGRRAATPNDPAMLFADVTRMREELGGFEEISLKDGLADYVASCREGAPLCDVSS